MNHDRTCPCHPDNLAATRSDRAYKGPSGELHYPLPGCNCRPLPLPKFPPEPDALTNVRRTLAHMGGAGIDYRNYTLNRVALDETIEYINRLKHYIFALERLANLPGSEETDSAATASQGTDAIGEVTNADPH